MPKETVATTQPTAYVDNDETKDPIFDGAIEVRWQRGTEYFQIASVQPSKQFTREQAGWYVTLDRTNINKLIAVLRRARDQAFGRDE